VNDQTKPFKPSGSHTHTQTIRLNLLMNPILVWSGQVRSSGGAHNAALYLTSRTGITTSAILKVLYCEHTIFYVSI